MGAAHTGRHLPALVRRAWGITIMPIFEFICEECGQTFEELVRSASLTLEMTCPKCQSAQVHKKISRIAARIGSDGAFTSGFSSSASSCATST